MNTGVLSLVFIISIIVFGVILAYVYITKTNEIEDLHLNISKHESKIQDLNKNITKLENDFTLVKFVCIFSSIDCKGQYSKYLLDGLLKSNGITIATAKEQSVLPSINYKIYWESKDASLISNLLPSKLKEFIETNCPSEIYTGTIVTRYDFKFNDKLVGVLMDENKFEILCAWIFDAENYVLDGNYILIR